MTASITREAALRLGMAVKELGGVSLHGFVQAVGERIGPPLTETRLATVTVTDLREILAGNHAEEDCKVGVEPDTLKKAVRLIDHGAKFIGTNPDMIDPVEGGLEPAAGTFLAAISAATGKKPYIVGKPNSLMMMLAARKLGAPAKRFTAPALAKGP